jgi:hypothetical protein
MKGIFLSSKYYPAKFVLNITAAILALKQIKNTAIKLKFNYFIPNLQINAALFVQFNLKKFNMAAVSLYKRCAKKSEKINACKSTFNVHLYVFFFNFT